MDGWITISDSLIALVWICINVSLGLGALRTARFLLRSHPPSVHWLASITVFLTAIWSLTLLLGSIGFLNRWSLLVGGGLLGCVLCFRFRPLPNHRVERKSRVGSQKWTTGGWVLLASLGVSHVIWRGLLGFPHDFDSLMYHLPIVVEWIQESNLYTPESSYWWTPGNSEVLVLWIVAPFSGDYLFALGNVPFVLMWAIGTYRLCRELRLPIAWSHLFSMAAMLTFTTLDELDDSQNDIAIAALFVSGAAFGFQFLRRPSGAALAMLCLCTGALPGVKYNALGYAVLVVVSVASVCVLQRRYRDVVRCLLCSVLGFLLLSSYWYVRNWMVSGSPLYPMGLCEDIASGYPDVLGSTLWGNSNPNVAQFAMLALWKMTGPIHYVSVWIVPVALIGMMVVALNAKRWAESARLLYLSFLFFGTFVLLLITPFCVEDVPGSLNHLVWAYTPARYGLSFLTMIVVAIAVVIHRGWRSVVLQFVSKKHERSLLIAISLLIVIQTGKIIFGGHHAHASSITFDFFFLFFDVVLAMIFVGMAAKQFEYRFKLGMIVCIGLLISVLIGVRASDWHRGFGDHFNQHFQSDLFPNETGETAVWGDRVMVLDMRSYPFFGSKRITRVYRPRSIGSLEQVIDTIDTNAIRYVATHKELNREYYLYTDTFRWLQAADESFCPVPTRGYFSLFERAPAAPHQEVDRPRGES